MMPRDGEDDVFADNKSKFDAAFTTRELSSDGNLEAIDLNVYLGLLWVGYQSASRGCLPILAQFKLKLGTVMKKLKRTPSLWRIVPVCCLRVPKERSKIDLRVTRVFRSPWVTQLLP